MDKLAWMGQNARFLRHQSLQGREWQRCFKYRVGDYRIIYTMDQSAEELTVLKVGHRREVYG
jgi:mRNA interferase RelE/StbE